jgi:uncharacterized protein with GYD domain
MGKYLFHGTYTPQGLGGVIKEGGTSRQRAVPSLAESIGGRLESFHFAFGKDSFHAASVTNTVLLTPEQVDTAVKRSPSYRAPGQ